MQRPVRILFTLPWATRSGGAEQMLQALVDGGAAAGYESELVFLQDGPWPAELRARGLRVQVIEAGRIRQLRAWLAAVRRLARIMREREPDLIVNWTGKTQLYGAPAALLCGMSERVVWWQHAITPTHHWLDRCATLLPARAIGCTSHAAAAAQARLRPRRRTFVVAAGAAEPPAHLSAPALALPGGVPVIGLVARLQPWKGQDRLLRAAALLRERGRELHLLLVGGDSWGLAPDYARSLPALIEQLGLAGMVTMTGEVPDAGPYIGRMDVLVNASAPEPFGIVLLEAMARGVAVVAVDAGGPREIIDPGRSGVLARSGEPAALADAIEPLLSSPARRLEIAAAGRERYREQFTNETMCRRFSAVAHELSGRAAPAG